MKRIVMENNSNDDSYLATIQKKSMVEGLNLQFLETNLNHLKKDVECYKSNYTKRLENQVALPIYENEEAKLSKVKAHKETLKRKYTDSSDAKYNVKRAVKDKVVSDSIHENVMEYNNVVFNGSVNTGDLITVHSHSSKGLILYPRNIVNASLPGVSNKASLGTSSSSTASSIAYKNKSFLTSSTQGNDDDSSDDGRDDKNTKGFFENVLAQSHMIRQIFLDGCENDSELENVLKSFEHAYNGCNIVKDEERKKHETTNSIEEKAKCHIVNCTGVQSKACGDSVMKEILNAKELSNVHQRFLDVFTYHSLAHTAKHNCAVPLCSSYWSCILDLFKSAKHLDGSVDFQNESAQVLYSNTKVLTEGNKVNEGVDFYFNFENYIAKGGFGHVFDTWIVVKNHQARVAVKKILMKTLTPDKINVPEMCHLFKQLGPAPNLLIPDLVLSSNQLTYFVMEKGEISLSQYLLKSRKNHENTCQESQHTSSCNSGLSLQNTSLYFVQMARGLAYLHDMDFTHGDVKLANAMIMPGYRQVKLIDFDTLKRESKKKASGTHGYAAPEVYTEKNVIIPSDVYSLCSCLPELIWGLDMSYRDNTHSVKMLEDIAERNSNLAMYMENIDHDYAEVFRCGTNVNPTERPTVKKLIACFKQNKQLKEYYEADVEIPPLYDIVLEPSSAKDLENVTFEEHKEKTLCKNVFRKRLNKVMDTLEKRLPLQEPDESDCIADLINSQALIDEEDRPMEEDVFKDIYSILQSDTEDC